MDEFHKFEIIIFNIFFCVFCFIAAWYYYDDQQPDLETEKQNQVLQNVSVSAGKSVQLMAAETRKMCHYQKQS